ncbi:tRNA binding protein, putative [Plasmodium relictum]|uniref:tRNA binding protein, putative n=1 Tax=Plasmodium relictum TaxID=85471 RepID=A0A1J1H9M2_PLARL|nr:tRNA binding protein, putative [Plasmodium relictum]CRH01503.1 tRNA binding protein, putative [Plasmodium relictum]
MCTLTLVKNDVKSDILKLVLDYIKVKIVKDDEKVTFPEILYQENICFDNKNKKYKGFFCTLYSLIDFYDCFNELFNEDEGKISENEEFIFHVASDKYIVKNLDIKHLNDLLSEKSYIVSNKNLSIVDIFYFCAIYKSLDEMPFKERVEISHVYRWFLHIQETLLGCFSTLKKLEVRDSLENFINNKDIKDTNEKMKSTKKQENKKENSKNENAKSKNKNVKNVEEPRSLYDISRLNIIVGYIEQVEVHPDADTLYCLKVNVGEEKVRDICSGLRNVKKAEDLINQYVLVLANLKEKSLRGRKSHGMVLCGSFQGKIELLYPPSGVKIGERIICENMNINNLPDKALSFDKEKNPFYHIQPHLILKNGIAHYKDDKLISSQGDIKCILLEGTIS